ncbi:hypothetical protein BC941DRAFT_421633 [Chlamydoabsidia padenii]|nr:hypothetical protein BC941DRAFT_421633 [Chlamydoabsidia padenii]
MYSTYILVHPRTRQLQDVLTLEDYHRIQALLEYSLKRQQQQHLLEQMGDSNREHMRLVQALYNNRLLQMDYRRQRAAQLERLMQCHHDRVHHYDRARILAALEKQRAQQAFHRFIDLYNQQQDQKCCEKQEEESGIEHGGTCCQQATPVTRQDSTPAQQETSSTPIQSAAQQVEDQQEDEEPIDDAYEQYQTQKLEDLLKHIFEKNNRTQSGGGNEQDDYVYAPVQAQKDHQDEKTMEDLLPLMDDNGTPVESISAQEQSTDVDDNKPYLPDNVLQLQDVLDELIRTPTPAVQPSGKGHVVTKPDQNKRDSPPPVNPPKEQEPHSEERQRKLDQLSAVEQKLDQLTNDNENDKITRLPLQYQVNDQGGLYLDGNTADNRTFLMYEDEIIRCMIQLDQILSDGDTVVRDRRRQAVKRAEALLEPVDRHKQDEWTRATTKQVGGGKKKKQRHRHHGKRKARIPVTA